MSTSRQKANVNKSLVINIKLKRVEPRESSESSFTDSFSNSDLSLPKGAIVPHLNGEIRSNRWEMRSAMSSSSELVKQKLQFLIPDSDHDAFKHAIYNGLVFVVLGLCGVGLWATYHLLLAFIKPIMWAVLAGTVLFPLKQSVTNVIRGWLNGLKDSGTPLVLGTVALPFKWLDLASEKIWAIVASKNVFFVIGGYLALQIVTLEGVFVGIIGKIVKFFTGLDLFIDFLASKWVIPFFILYFIVYVTWLYFQPEDWSNKKLARILSVPIWLIVLTFLSQFFGPFQPFVMIGASTVVALIAAGVLTPGQKEAEEDESAEEEEVVPSGNQGNTYLKGIFCACLLLWAVKHAWVTVVLLIPFFYAIMKKIVEQLGLWDLIGSKSSSIWESLTVRFRPVFDIAVPKTIRQFFRFLFAGDQMLVDGLDSKMDLISSLVVMLLMVIASIFFLFFVVFQVHGEVVHLVRLGGNILSAEDGSVRGAMNFTGQKLSEHDLEGYVDQAYQYGRSYLTSKVRELAAPSDVDRADMLEAQVKLLMDQLFEMWSQRDQYHYHREGKKEKHDLSIWSLGSLDYGQVMSELQQIVMENIETLQSILTSMWSVVSANVMFISSIFGAFAVFLLSFFMELLSFFIEMIVFLTSLYYLLASSTKQWKPLEWLSSLAPPSGKKKSDEEEDGWGMSKAVEEAISGVFELSSKMSIFYGLYTWFMHSLFGLNIVFVPSLLAALFAAVPLTAPYMVSVLGFLELWLVKGELWAALIFLLASLAPMVFADTAFYSEVKGSHPYVTGLAIVGGIYWLGLEGAIVGPILLCCILVLFKMMLSVRSSVAAN